jgi:hypothetical protein
MQKLALEKTGMLLIPLLEDIVVEKISKRNLCQLTVCNGDGSLERSKLLSVRQVSLYGALDRHTECAATGKVVEQTTAR